ncbi:MAG: 2-succinyl-5-enolpyruvyl-6-hydroxy-3-cyclohexene-1-carboxylic-acid synthase [Simkaniaceae bacterium]|nr:2-succinyl-5-enolpyruvyl-6-hydroxy-3-cyclohexene-1-carboxylic-acid synthase [Simkaniaceae bacterium]
MSWPLQLVKELVHQGVRSFCLSPGSRQTPLVLAIAKHPLAEIMVHYDERGMAFHALGRAKGSGLPVVLLVTSGTAVANLFPAIIEAKQTRTPLIILTADVPIEQVDVHAVQAIDQHNFFGQYVVWNTDIPCEDAAISEGYIGSLVAQAVYRSKNGPVHLNCRFREPLISQEHIKRNHRAHTVYTKTTQIIDEPSLEYIADELSGIEKGIIVTGRLGSSELEPLFTLARRLRWPILPDILSEVRSAGSHEFVIPHFDYILDQPEAILHLGDQFVSKKLQMKAPLICHVASYPERVDASLAVTHRIECPPLLFCEKLHPLIPGSSSSTWLKEWKDRSVTATKKLKQQQTELSEVSIPLLLSEILDDKRGLFLGNSMPIRDANLFYFPKQKVGPIIANRGVSGIDGNIASAIGFSIGIDKPVVAVLGDLTFLHDMNSLAQHTPYPMTYIVINNGGGGIFSFLPIHEQKEVFESFFATPHTYHFDKVAEMFHVGYQRISNLDTLKEHLLASKDDSQILEVVTCREENLKLHRSLEMTCQPSKEFAYD